MKVLKVVSGSGVYYTNTHKDIPYGSDVTSYSWIELSEEEYNAIPATEEAAKFFRGEVVGQRPKE